MHCIFLTQGDINKNKFSCDLPHFIIIAVENFNENMVEQGQFSH